jgi:glutamate/tyrosine decarboxylase-like PLP-dependent enzyme
LPEDTEEETWAWEAYRRDLGRDTLTNMTVWKRSHMALKVHNFILADHHAIRFYKIMHQPLRSAASGHAQLGIGRQLQIMMLNGLCEYFFYVLIV